MDDTPVLPVYCTYRETEAHRPRLDGISWELGHRASSLTLHLLSSDAFDFNYGVCVMRMREGLNVSEALQTHSEYLLHLMSPVKNQYLF